MILPKMMDAVKGVKLKPQLYESPTQIQLCWKWGQCAECEDSHVLKNMKIIIWACFSAALQEVFQGWRENTASLEQQPQSSWEIFAS